MQQRGNAVTVIRLLTAYSKDEWRRSRVLLGVFAAVLHALGCLFYLGMAKLYLFVKSNDEAVLALRFTGADLLRFFDVVIAASLMLSVLHGLAVFSQCYWVVASDRRRSTRNKLESWNHALEARTGADAYELLVVVEIGLQTFQAHKMSRLVATHWINRLMALAIVVNCWIVPGATFLFKKKPLTYVKVVQLALDAVIEIVYGMAIPLAIFYPYYRDGNAILYDSPFLGWYDDVMFVNAIAENLQLYVSSWLDFVSKMAPGFSLLLRVYAFQVHRVEHESRTRAASLVVAEPTHSTWRKKRALNALMGLWGLGILVAHLIATTVSVAGRDPGCLLEPIPLGSARYSCAVLEVSCSQKRIDGTKRELDAALEHVEPLTVQALIFSHCESLSMPPRLKTFANLIEIKIHNVSIAEWGEDAALTAQEHPVMRILYITLTNMTRIPDGVRAVHPPPLLVDIELCGTNLTVLPDNLFDKWPQLPYFGLELSPGITEFPRALQSSSAPLMFSLASNAISELPDDIFAHHEFRLGIFARNPIERLPMIVGSAATAFMSFTFTKVETIPASWLAATDQFVENGSRVMAKGTPLCASLLEIRSRHTGSLPDDKVTLPWILCDGDAYSSSLVYPLEMEKELRARSRG